MLAQLLTIMLGSYMTHMEFRLSACARSSCDISSLYIYIYIFADLENRICHLWWPNFLQPNSILCLPTQQASVPRGALGHAKFLASFLS